MKTLIIFKVAFIAVFICSSCSNSSIDRNSNNDPELVGKWVRKNKYHLDFYRNGIGSKEKNVLVTENIKKFKKERINWVSFNNNFLIINSDEKVMGFSYQVIGDTLFMRQPEDNIEFFIRLNEENKE